MHHRRIIPACSTLFLVVHHHHRSQHDLVLHTSRNSKDVGCIRLHSFRMTFYNHHSSAHFQRYIYPGINVKLVHLIAMVHRLHTELYTDMLQKHSSSRNGNLQDLKPGHSHVAHICMAGMPNSKAQ